MGTVMVYWMLEQQINIVENTTWDVFERNVDSIQVKLIFSVQGIPGV